MTFVSISYHERSDISSPEAWFDRIKMYRGSWELIARQHRVIRIEHIAYKGQAEHDGIQYYFRPAKKSKLYFPRKLHRLIRSLNPDIVTVHGLHFPLQTIVLKYQLPSSVKIIVQHHAEKPFNGFKKFWQLWAGRSIDAYLFASAKMGREWVRRGNIDSEQKIHEVMEVSSCFQPVEKSFARSMTGVHGDPVFLWVGRLDRNKDPLTMVKAFMRFGEYQPFAKLLLIYQTQEMPDDLKKLLAHERSQQVHLVGSIPYENMAYWYNSADFLISTSHYEGSGTAVCEAMSCGCIPILSDIDSFRAITGDFQCGLSFEAGDEEGLLEKLLLATQLDRKEESNKTIERFKQALSFEAIAEKIQAVADSLIDTKQ